MNIEQKTADTILQNPIKIKLGGKEYDVAPPSTATLIETSKFIATLPTVEYLDDIADIITALKHAKNAEYLGDIIAILILGKKGLKKQVENTITKKRFFGLIEKEIKEVVEVDCQSELATEILENTSPKEVFETLFKIMDSLEIGFFLQTTIFLNEVNLTKPTKTTASGD